MAHVTLPLEINSGPNRELLLKTAARRLYPSLMDPNYLVLRARRIVFQKWIEQLKGVELSVLDVGGRYQPYRPLFRERTGRYIACDIWRTDLVNVVGSGELLPFAADSFDVVIATQVFDYLLQPQKAAEQIHAVLKPGGCLLMSVPSVAPRFAEDERWRFTPSGIRTILSCYSEIAIVPETSSLGGVIRTLNLAICQASRGKLLQSLFDVTICPLLNLAGFFLESLALTKNDLFTPNYSVMAIK